MLRAVYEHMIASLATALGVAVVKGYPTWGRPGLEPPIASLELTGYLAERPTRVGQVTGRRRGEFALTVFARNEPEMIDMVEKAVAWFAANVRLEVNGYVVDCEIPSASRHTNESGTQQEAYACILTYAATWSE